MTMTITCATVSRHSTQLPRQEKTQYICLALFIVVFCSASAIYDFYKNPLFLFPFDDSYITLHNARTLIAGYDAEFPGNARSEQRH